MPSSAPALRKLVNRFVGRSDTSLTMEESKTAKEMYPDEYAQYRQLRKDFIAEWKATIQKICAGGMQKYSIVESKLASAGFENTLSQGFDGYIDASGKLYSLGKELIEGAPTVSFYPQVEMNPEYGPDEAWVFRGIKVDGSKGAYFYTSKFKHDQRVSKHKKVALLDLPAIRKKWLPMVKNFDPADVRTVCATVLETLFQFTARIGTIGNPTFGICTLQVKHVFPTAQGITLKYKGKDSVSTTHKLLRSKLDHKFLIANIEQLLEGKDDPKTPLFTIERSGKLVRLYPNTVNKFWHACGAPADVTVHKIRTWWGTKIFFEAVTKILTTNRPKNLAQAKAAYKAAAEAVGKSLNHIRASSTGDKVTGVTALNSYVDPGLQILYWQELGYPVPAKLQKFVHQDSE